MIVKGQTGKTECLDVMGLGKEKGTERRALGCRWRRTLDCQLEGKSLEGHFPSPRGLWDFRATHASIPAQKAPKLRHLVTFLELQEVSAWEEGVRLRVAVALN